MRRCFQGGAERHRRMADETGSTETRRHRECIFGVVEAQRGGNGARTFAGDAPGNVVGWQTRQTTQRHGGTENAFFWWQEFNGTATEQGRFRVMRWHSSCL